MIAKRILSGRALAAALGAGLLASVSAAMAQTAAPTVAAPSAEPQWDKKRLDRLERNVEKLENTIAHAKPDKAPPNLIEPDVEVVALTSRVDDLTGRLNDMEGSLRKVNGELDAANLEVDKSHRAETAAKGESQALAQRLATLENKIAGMEQAALQVQATQAAAAADSGSLAGGGTAPAAPQADAGAEFKAAKKLLLEGDYPGAGRALQEYINRWPDSAQAPEAHYQLGETLYVRDDRSGAAAEYAHALKGWPHNKWAPDAVIKLGQAMVGLGKTREACGAVAEFDKRYGKEAATPVKTRAAALRSKAKCG